MKKGKKSFKDIFEKIDWLMIEPARRSWKLAADAVAIGFYAKYKDKPEEINEVRIRIGSDILQKIKWTYGDKICVLHDPDDLMSFYLTKTENGKGFTLGKEQDSGIGRIVFKWDRKIPIQQRDCSPVKYHIYKNGLVIFRVGSQEEETEE